MNDGLDEILEDAKRVARYGQRAGRLRSPQLFEAIAAFEAPPAKGWSAPEAVALQQALNQAAMDIAPTTLNDIRRKDPFAPHTKADRRQRIGLIVFSILLMVVTAYFTILYNRGSDLALQLESIDRSRPAEKMAAVAREWRSAKIEEDGTSSETYYKMLDELRELDSQVKTYYADYLYFKAAMNPIEYFGSQYFTFRQVAGTTDTGYRQVTSCGTPSASPADATVASFLATPPGSILKQNRSLVLNFACAESLMISPYSMPWLASLGSDVEKILRVFGFWVLPGLYGALGATIFYMRSILNPILPDPPMEQIVHRVALGGFSGIIFAWFWAPSPQSTEQFAGLSINSFAIAFVIGFSIDVLFTLLDRLVSFLQNATSMAAAQPAGTVLVSAAAIGAGGQPSAQPAKRPGQAVAIIRSVSPPAVQRAQAPAALVIEGENLAGTQAVVLKRGTAAIQATDVAATANAVNCKVLLDQNVQDGDWALEIADKAGKSAAAPRPVTVT